MFAAGQTGRVNSYKPTPLPSQLFVSESFFFLSLKPQSFFRRYDYCYGPGSSAGIGIEYGLDGPGSNPGGDEIFRPSRPALRPTQPPVKWVLGLSRG